MFGTSVKRGAFCLTQRLYSFLFNSLRGKSSRLVSEQRSRKTEERDFRFGLPEKWNEGQKMEEGGGGGEGRKPSLPFFPTPPRSFTRAIFHAVSDSCASFFAPNPRETLATQAIFLRVLSWAWTLRQVSTTGVYAVACIKDNLHRPPVHSVCVTAARSLFCYPRRFPVHRKRESMIACSR